MELRGNQAGSSSSRAARRLRFLALTVAFAATAQSACVPPEINEAVLEKDVCTALSRVCADDGVLVTFDPAFAPDNLTHANPLGTLQKQWGLW